MGVLADSAKEAVFFEPKLAKDVTIPHGTSML